ncbi:MAG: MFS transporter [Anaerolineae bacterium]|nr:MFS transporter [Anaerolineae bacterium]
MKNNVNVLEDSKFQTSNVTALSIGHWIFDTYQAFLPAFLPIFLNTFSLTNMQGGALSAFNQFPSLIQPVIGYISDRRNLRWIVILAPAISAVTMSLLGVVPGYWTIALLLMIAGFSSAGLHAVGPAIAGKLSGNKIGRGMSFWMVAGEVGRALGPLAVVTVIKFFGLKSTPLLMIFGLGASVLLYFKLRKIPNHSVPNDELTNWRPALKKVAPFVLAISAINLSVAFLASGISTFLPIYLTGQGSTLWFAGASLTILQIAGVAGALVSGIWSDKIGRKPLLISAILISPIALVLFVYTSGFLRIVFLLIMGFAMISVQPVLMAWIQQSYPDQRALANGSYMAITFVIRSGIVIVIGWMGDQLGLSNAFLVCAGIMLITLPIVMLTPTNPIAKPIVK